MTKKQIQQENRRRKEEFFEEYSSIIIAKYYPKVKMFQHHIKIEINGIEFDYYPGGQRLCKIESGRYNKYVDFTIKEFLDMLQIKENFSSREEVLSTLNIFNGDL
jgi:hypothetical protein